MVAAACGGKTEGTVGSAGSTSGGSTDAATGSGTATGGSSSSAGTTGGGLGCGDGCGADEWCNSPVNRCADDPDGQCRPRPVVCDDILMPVCGCDGEVYANACEAQAAGVDVAEAVDCAPPDGMFQCGFIFCDPKAQYCVQSGSDLSGFPDEYACEPLPGGCDPPSCACLKDAICGFNCEQVQDGGFKTLCPGG